VDFLFHKTSSPKMAVGMYAETTSQHAQADRGIFSEPQIVFSAAVGMIPTTPGGNLRENQLLGQAIRARHVCVIAVKWGIPYLVK
jgi:hypothetical protein